MKKNLFYTALGLIGIMGTLAIGVVNAETTITHYTGSNISYTLNGNELFTGVGTITIQSGDEFITILDRNLGATATGYGADSTMKSYGYYFQRGNNYGFATSGEIPSGNASDANVDATLYGPNNPYSSGVFLKTSSRPFDWATTANNNLWGGSGDTTTIAKVTNPEERQGPCPDGWHVPSYSEWKTLIDWIGSSNSNRETFREKLYIPYAGSRYFNTASPNQGSNAYLLSSSPNGTYSRRLRLNDYYLNVDDSNGRANAYSVRCFYDSYQPYAQSLTLSFMSRDMVLGTGEVVEDKVYTGDIPNVTETGYILEYRYLSGADATTGFDFENEAITGGMANEEGVVYFIAKWTPVEYAITFVDGSGMQTNIIYSGEYNSAVSTDYPNWTKDGYTIHWDKEIPETMPLNGETITASRTENKKPSGGSSGGGGRSKTSNDSQISPDPSLSRGEEDSSLIKEGDREAVEDLDSTTPMDSSADKSASELQTYSEEFQQAYNFAHEKGITTMPTIQKADMDGKLTRIAMAKMLSQYAMNILGQKPANIVVPKFSDISEKLDADYDNGVTLAYQLGIMGQNMPDNKFRPNDEVTRAEFATALSRMLYNTSDGEYKSTPKYYLHHMEKLVKEGIITNDNPNMKELRGYVMIMLMRSAK